MTEGEMDATTTLERVGIHFEIHSRHLACQLGNANLSKLIDCIASEFVPKILPPVHKQAEHIYDSIWSRRGIGSIAKTSRYGNAKRIQFNSGYAYSNGLRSTSSTSSIR